jgi:nucleoside transporter
MTTAAPLDYAPPAQRAPFFRLSLMMFLQYAVWGVWLPILAKYFATPIPGGGLGFSQLQIGAILGLAGSIGAVSAPFIAGQLADRIMNAERALGIMLILGALVKFAMTTQTSYSAWMGLSILYSILYMPTLSLSNSVAFAHCTDREKQFPPIRMWGTIGWIIASVLFPLFYMKTGAHFVSYWPFVDGTARPDEVAQIRYAMMIGGIISLAYGIYCFALPATPPTRDARRPIAFAAAFKLLTAPRVLALLIAALLVSMIHQVYFFRTPSYLTDAIKLPASDIGSTMAIGQVSEIIFLAILGFFLKRIGYKWIIILGALSYALRYGIFATIPSAAAVKWIMLLHGMNYGFFFAGSFLFVERISPADIRHSTQIVFGIIILGLGPVLAMFYNGWLDRLALTGTVTDYGKVWGVQAAIAFVSALILLIGFPGRVAVADGELLVDPPAIG